MITERIGKFFLSKTHPAFLYLLLLVPICIAGIFLFSEFSKISEQEENFYLTCKKGKSALHKKKEKEHLIKRYSDASPYFVDEHIESQVFLQKEKDMLEALLKHPALMDKREIEARLSFLSQGENRLFFTEEEIRSSNTMKETEEKQRHPVQMDATDLKHLLSLMEDLQIEQFFPPKYRPQTVITDFRLEEKQTLFRSPVFEVEMQFIKREFIP